MIVLTSKAKPVRQDLCRLVEWLGSNDAYRWLPYDSWLSGGCWLLGAALLQLLPGSELWWVVCGTDDEPSHAVVKYEGHFIDGSGVYTEEDLLDYWYHEQYLEDPYLEPGALYGDEYLKGIGLVCPMTLVDELAELLQEVLSGERKAAAIKTEVMLL